MKKSPDEQSKEPMVETPKLNSQPNHLTESAAYLRATATWLKKEVKVLEDAADALDHVYALSEK